MKPSFHITAALALGLHLAVTNACAAESAKSAKGGSRAAKEKTMNTSSITFFPIELTQFPQSGSRTPEGRLPNDFGTPPQLFWIRNEAGFARFGFKVPDASPGAGTTDTGANTVDFSRHDVILLTMGVQGTTGFDLKLLDVKKSGQEIRFMLKAKIPGRFEGVGEALTHPGVLASVDKLPRDSRLVMEMNGQETSFQLRILE